MESKIGAKHFTQLKSSKSTSLCFPERRSVYEITIRIYVLSLWHFLFWVSSLEMDPRLDPKPDVLQVHYKCLIRRGLLRASLKRSRLRNGSLWKFFRGPAWARPRCARFGLLRFWRLGSAVVILCLPAAFRQPLGTS